MEKYFKYDIYGQVVGGIKLPVWTCELCVNNDISLALIAYDKGKFKHSTLIHVKGAISI